MRERLFRKLIRSFEGRPSGFVSRIQIQILTNATAEAFKSNGKCVLFSKDPLMDYAEFTKKCMNSAADPEKLFKVSLDLGEKVRKVTGFTDPADLTRLVFFLYRNIGISMSGEIPGELTISECFFSRVYSAEQCCLISAMDHGIIAGICGDGMLSFCERITEGCEHCTARFTGVNTDNG